MSKFMYYSAAALSGRPGTGCIYCMCCEEFQDSNSAGLFLCTDLSWGDYMMLVSPVICSAGVEY